MTNVINQMCPLKKFKVKTVLEPWITNELLEQIKDKDLALKRAKRSKRQDHWTEARTLRNNCLQDVRKAKADFICEKLDENISDSNKFWGTINSILPGKKNSSHDISLLNENVEVHKEEIPNYMNNYFSKIGSSLAEKFDNQLIMNHVLEECPNILQPFLTDEVLKVVKEINVTKSSATKNISSRLMKEAFYVQITRLVKIFNISVACGIVPDFWKNAMIIPLHKGGSARDVNNFRPVSLLPIQGKLKEKIVHERLMSHCENNFLLDKNQGGFRKNHSTTNLTVNFLNDIYSAMNDGQLTLAVFIDLRKAFDTVNHNILCDKLSKFGVKNLNLKWIKNYLHNRMQTTLVNNMVSTTSSITCGVPQGSVLGPLLFLIYVNNMPNSLQNTKHCLYADDTVLYLSGDNIYDVVTIKVAGGFE